MANDVYRAAVDGLTALVPPKAARRLVDDSLRATKRTSDDVSVAAMRRLLLGPIREELAGVLPPSAVGPGLKRIAAGLHAEAPRSRRWWRRGRAQREPVAEPDLAHDDAAEDEATEPVSRAADVPKAALAAASKAAATSGPGPSVRSSMITWVPPAEREAIEAAIASRASAVPPAETRDEPTAAVAQHPTHGETNVAVPKRPGRPRAPLPRLDDALLGRALKSFGELETVRQVVAVRKGELVSSSGEGLEPGELPALVHATTRLLERAGRLNVFALENASGSMFLFPLAGGGLVVLTKPKVNFGAVLAARAALEEAA